MARRKKGNPIHGWLVIDKPYGMGSTTLVGQVKRLMNAQKVGHSGTLDPLASGILPLALGEATKTVSYVMDGTKVYDFRVKWGEQTNTDDIEGPVIATSDHRPTADEITAVLPEFTGDVMQRPPAFSAIKVAGERAYDLARDGEEVVLPPRPVWIERVELLKARESDADMRLACGKGTYVRSLARDLGVALGTYGHVTALRRIKTGSFDLSHAISLDTLSDLVHRDPASVPLVPLETALDDILALAISEEEAIMLRRGQPISMATKAVFDRFIQLGEPEEFWADCDGKAVALCEARHGGIWPKRVFNH